MPSELRFGRHMFSGFYLPDSRKNRIVHSRHLRCGTAAENGRQKNNRL
ncbi:hypothetical protein [Neisseria blantyrii]|nr:hypothetical protein [Neisseria blantyrii]